MGVHEKIKIMHKEFLYLFTHKNLNQLSQSKDLGFALYQKITMFLTNNFLKYTPKHNLL